MSYRTGRHLGRTIYRVGHDGYEALIGIMDTADDGALVVEALNARERVLGANEQVGERAAVPPWAVASAEIPPRPATPPDPPPSASMPSTCGRVGMHECGITGRYKSHDSGNLPPSEYLLLPSEQGYVGEIL